VGGEKLKIKLNSAKLELDLGLSLATVVTLGRYGCWFGTHSSIQESQKKFVDVFLSFL
jgi:hypothetical protein